jgi:hypothetical protein
VAALKVVSYGLTISVAGVKKVSGPPPTLGGESSGVEAEADGGWTSGVGEGGSTPFVLSGCSMFS